MQKLLYPFSTTNLHSTSFTNRGFCLHGQMRQIRKCWAFLVSRSKTLARVGLVGRSIHRMGCVSSSGS
jgi:hypothetical protein